MIPYTIIALGALYFAVRIAEAGQRDPSAYLFAGALGLLALISIITGLLKSRQKKDANLPKR